MIKEQKRFLWHPHRFNSDTETSVNNSPGNLSTLSNGSVPKHDIDCIYQNKVGIVDFVNTHIYKAIKNISCKSDVIS